jgi:hypothetical protein
MDLPEPVAGMHVRLRRAHACGSDVFSVGGAGADVRLFCAGCGAKVFLERPRWKTRVVEVLPAAPSTAMDAEAAAEQRR